MVETVFWGRANRSAMADCVICIIITDGNKKIAAQCRKALKMQDRADTFCQKIENAINKELWRSAFHVGPFDLQHRRFPYE
jgi:hypothetical protein